jgi:integrase/recombinase XerD
LKNRISIVSYRKRVYQIKKYLTYLKIDWIDNLKLPPEPDNQPYRITKDDILITLNYFKEHKYFNQIKAIILLGATSGIRAEEIYQLTTEDINLDNRTVNINHNPNNGQSTKTKKSRVSFFNWQTKDALCDYLNYFNNDNELKLLFSQSHISRLFKDSPIKIKDLRKYFSQEWDRRGGPTSIKKILMGHSLKGDVDLMHYNAQSPEDLKRIYDKVMNGNINEKK